MIRNAICRAFLILNTLKATRLRRGRPAASGLTESDRRRNRQFAELTPLFRAWSHKQGHQGVTAESPLIAELAVRDPEPEETPAEAAEREAEELERHWAKLERLTDDDVAELERIDHVLEPLRAAVDEACRVVLDELGLSDDEADRLLAVYRAAAEPTGGWPTVLLPVVTV